MYSFTSSLAFSLLVLNSITKSRVSLARSLLHSPQSKFPLLHLIYLSNDSFSLSKKYLRYQYTGHISAFAPNFFCNEIVGCPPVKADSTFFSTISGSSVVKIAVSGLEEDILYNFDKLGKNLLCI